MIHNIFNILFGFEEARAKQDEVYRKIVEEGARHLFVRLPCAYGKTEAAIAPFLSQTIKDDWFLAPRLIYVLPIRTYCNQVGERIQEHLERVNKKYNMKLELQVHHGAYYTDPYFMADIVVTTLDQFIYGYARAVRHLSRHMDLPAGSIATSCVIFDEAHMYSPYTHALLRAVLRILHRAQIPFMMMTATMPRSLQQDLTQDLDLRFVEYDPEKKWEEKRDIKVKIYDKALIRNGKVNPKLADIIPKEGPCLIVLNTVDKAASVYEWLGNKGFRDIVLIHSRFTIKDREELERKVSSRLGKGGSRGIVVSTQVCEAGLDISSDTLITECAPADSLVQRSGRCARWGGQGEVHIFNVEEPHPYENEHIELASDYLRKFKPNLGKWDDLCTFVDKMPYRVDAVSANTSLYELMEATLYADARPDKLTVREEEFIRILVPPESALKDDKTLQEFILQYKKCKESMITLPFKFALKKSGEILARREEGKKGFRTLRYSPTDEKLVVATTPRIYPYGRYIVKQGAYKPKLGLIA